MENKENRKIIIVRIERIERRGVVRVEIVLILVLIKEGLGGEDFRKFGFEGCLGFGKLV